MGSEPNEMVSNKQVIQCDFVVTGSLKVSDMLLKMRSAKLKVPEGLGKAVLQSHVGHPDEEHEGPRFSSLLRARFTDKGIRSGHSLDLRNLNFREGNLIWGLTTWEEYSLITEPEILLRVEHTDVPPSYYTGMLGLTAYIGFFKICSAKKGETIFVSAASGAVRQLVRQFAKSLGCYVIETARSQEKVDLLKSKFGFDEAFNYKDEPDLDAALKRCFPEGINMYFDNVGGKMIYARLLNMKTQGRIAACRMISQYNLDRPDAVHNPMNIVLRQIRVEGFLTSDRFYLYLKFLELVLPLIREGKIGYVEDIIFRPKSGPSTHSWALLRSECWEAGGGSGV